MLPPFVSINFCTFVCTFALNFHTFCWRHWCWAFYTNCCRQHAVFWRYGKTHTTHNTHHPVGRGGREQARARLRKTRPTPMKGKSLIKVTHSLRFRVEAGRRRKLKVMSGWVGGSKETSWERPRESESERVLVSRVLAYYEMCGAVRLRCEWPCLKAIGLLTTPGILLPCSYSKRREKVEGWILTGEAKEKQHDQAKGASHFSCW